MSGFTSMSVGVNGLMAAQIALNNTSNNITNAETKGYVRQITIFNDYSYNNIGSADHMQQIGRGVFVSETSRVRDILLDKAYREQAGRGGFYDSLYNASTEVETILGELEGVAFQDDLEKLWSALSEVANDPESTVAKTEIVMSAETFLTTAKATYGAMTEYQQTLNTEIKNKVAKINQLGDKIRELNALIQDVEGPKIEDANNYRDQRDLALDELSELIDISYTELEVGIVTVMAEGVPFVTEGNVFHMEVEELDGTNDSSLLTPVWPHVKDDDGNKGRVFDLETKIATSKGNDIGSLKGLVLARGGYPAQYDDVPKASDYATEAEYDEAVKRYNLEINPSILMKSEALYDKLLNGIVETINDIYSPTTTASFTLTSLGVQLKAGTNQGVSNVYFSADAASNGMPASTITIGANTYNVKTMLSTTENASAPKLPEDANTVYYYTDLKQYVFNPAQEAAATGLTVKYNYNDTRVLDSENCSVGADGKLPPQELFMREGTDRYKEVVADDGKTYYIFNEYSPIGRISKYTTSNIVVNPILLDDCSKLPSTTQNGYADMELGRKLLKAWDSEFAPLDPNYVTVKNFPDFYNELVYQVGNEGKLYLSMLNSQEKTAASLESSRQEMTGVSTDEELAYLVKFQSAYNASSRYINVIDEMLEHLIMRL